MDDGIEGLLARADRYAWLEAQLFATLGAAVAVVDNPGVVGLLAGHSRQHAWHAELWRERRPSLTSTRPDPPAASPPEALVSLLGALVHERVALAVLAAVHRGVVPHLVVAYRTEQRHAWSVRDLPTERTCRLVLADLTEQWASGQEALQLAMADDDGRAAAASWTARADDAMAAFAPSSAR